MQIGNVTTENNIFLAPMAGVTDLPFRLLCLEQGCGLVFTEMVSAKGIVYHNENTRSLLHTSVEESRYGNRTVVQLFGSDPQIMAEAAKIVAAYPFALIDINMGCPAPKIVKNGEGSALMKDPQRIYAIIAAIVKAVRLPVTVKFRKAFDRNSLNAAQAAVIAESAGASAVTVHGRTREEYYAGHADWDCIASVKAAVQIPVIGNGDVTDPATAAGMLAHTGCDGLMIGRAAQGNPWLFAEIDTYLRTGQMLPVPSLDEKKQMVLRHSRMLIECKGEHLAILEMRRHASFYLKGLPGAGALRVLLNKAQSYQELEALLLRV